MAYRFVASAHDLGLARGPRLGFTIHMAEGGGTVGYLSRPNPNGVSVHYVIEYDGDIVQMLREDHMHSSIRIRNADGSSALRRGDESPYTFRGETIIYGATAAKAVLGDWAYVGTTIGPNHATLAVEIEGFAADGPNDKQAASLKRLVADLRTRYPKIGLLGHRDHNVKGCPGKKVDWAALGGHGPASGAPAADEEEMALKGWPLPGGDGVVTLKEKRGLFHPFTGETIVPDDRVKNSYCRWHLAEPDSGDPNRQEGYLVRHAGQPWIAFDDACDFVATKTVQGPHSHNVSVDVDGQRVEGTVTYS